MSSEQVRFINISVINFEGDEAVLRSRRNIVLRDSSKPAEITTDNKYVAVDTTDVSFKGRPVKTEHFSKPCIFSDKLGTHLFVYFYSFDM